MPIPVHSSLNGGLVDKSDLSGLPVELAFSTEEYRERIRSTRKGMLDTGIDVLVLHHPTSVYYLSGYQSFSMYNGECVILPAQGEPILIVEPPEIGNALLHTWFPKVYGYVHGENRQEYQASLLSEQGLGRMRVGIEMKSEALPAEAYERLVEALPKTDLVDASDIMSTIKRIKSPQEIEYVRQAARMTGAGILAAVEMAKIGKTDNDVAAAGNQAIHKAGSEYMCVSPIVTSGRRSGILHSTHKRVPLSIGDSVCLEFGACFQRYSAPIMRTVFLGDPTVEVKRLADACLAALNNVLSSIKPGITSDEVARAGWDGLAMAGSGLVFHGVFGYSIGAGFPPTWADSAGSITLGNKTRLQPGMVFHHPVALRKLGEFGTMFSETSVVTKDGCEVLTDVEREMFIR